MSLPFLSIVIPAHKINEAFFRECVASVLQQTDPDFECVIVCDDGTATQNSIPNDSRFVLCSVPSCSNGKARNIGIAKSQGSWITFLDSDDQISADFVKEAKERLGQSDFDLLWCASTSDAKQMGRPLPEPTFESPLATAEIQKIFLSQLDPQKSVPLNLAFNQRVCWGKCYSASLLKQNRILFDEVQHAGEDVAFVIRFVLACTKPYVTSAVYSYFYRLNPESILHKKRDKQLRELNNFVSDIASVFSKNSLAKSYQSGFAAFVFSVISSWVLNELKKDHSGRARQKMVRELKNELANGSPVRHALFDQGMPAGISKTGYRFLKMHLYQLFVTMFALKHRKEIQ
jgi:glycosyltransferase involved in cell wall biosynthesis